MRAEHPAVGVRLVDHHPLQVGQEVAPALVVGEHPHVEHVRVGEDQVRTAPDPRPVLTWRVAVVDRVAQVRQPELGQLPCLVLGERLGRIEVERARLRVDRQALQDRQVERERLPGGRSGSHDHVALSGLAERLVLVAVEAVDAGARAARAPEPPGCPAAAAPAPLRAGRRTTSRPGDRRRPRSRSRSSTRYRRTIASAIRIASSASESWSRRISAPCAVASAAAASRRRAALVGRAAAPTSRQPPPRGSPCARSRRTPAGRANAARPGAATARGCRRPPCRSRARGRARSPPRRPRPQQRRRSARRTIPAGARRRRRSGAGPVLARRPSMCIRT